MPSERSHSLPEGVSDLIEIVDSQQQTERALGEIENEVVILGRKLAPLIIVRLFRQIDRDLIFTTDTDLVLPKIQETATDVYRGIAGENVAQWIVDILVEQVQVLIAYRRASGIDLEGVPASWEQESARKYSSGAIYHYPVDP